jgi:hypothetical protein
LANCGVFQTRQVADSLTSEMYGNSATVMRIIRLAQQLQWGISMKLRPQALAGVVLETSQWRLLDQNAAPHGCNNRRRHGRT